MNFGRVDRSGAREGKKSLRKNKIAINDKIKHGLPEPKKDEPYKKAQTPFLDAPQKGLIDVGCGLVNRRFESDTDKVISRAKNSSVDTMIIMSNDFEKQEALFNLAKLWPGTVYFMPGIHPDNVKRTNDKQMSTKMNELRMWAQTEHSVAIFCGLDYSREVSTHFAQEKLLIDQIELSYKLSLPIIFNQVAALEQLIDKILEYQTQIHKCAIYNFTGPLPALDAYLSLTTNVYFIITGIIADPSEKGDSLRDIITKIPIDKLLLATDSPFNTPQNISDVWMREGRNEPSNITFIVDATAKLLSMSTSDLSSQIRKNTKEFYGLLDKDDQQAIDIMAAAVDAEKKDNEEDNVEDDNNNDNQLEKESKQISELKIQDTPTKKEESKKEEEKGEVEVEVIPPTNDEIKYACKKCRKQLFTNKQILQHQATDEFATKSSRRRGKLRSVEVGVCQVLFIKEKETDWNNIKRGGMDDSDNDDDDDENDDNDDINNNNEDTSNLTEGRLFCPSCKSKLGRWSLAEELACSCGVEVTAPCFMVRKKNIDVIVPLKDANRLNEDLLLERETEYSSDDDDKKKGKKKKKSSNVKKINKGNFSSYRNKSYS